MEESIDYSEIEAMANQIVEQVNGLETLEIYLKQANTIHYVHNIEKTKHIPELLSFLNCAEEGKDLEALLTQKIQSNDFIYLNEKFVFMRVGAITDNYFSFFFLSKNPIGDCKRGLILIVDASGVVFFATCKYDNIKQFNLDLMNVLYPNY